MTLFGGNTYIACSRSLNALVRFLATQADIESDKLVAGRLKLLDGIR